MLKLSRCLTYEKFKWTSVKMRCIKEEDNVVKKEFQKKIHNIAYIHHSLQRPVFIPV